MRSTVRWACMAAGSFIAAGCMHAPLETPSEVSLARAVELLGFERADALLVAVGDIARCKNLPAAHATARLARAVVGSVREAHVITTGDHTYPNGTRDEFAKCYEPTWGALNAHTKPSPGNHDYETPGAAPYFEYFRLYAENAEARRRGYYAFDAGAWRVVSLNSNLSLAPNDTQVRWLAAELERSHARCVLAYWHHPLFSSGFHGRQRRDPGRETVAFWDVLERFDAELIVNGHAHMYERFAPQTSAGEASPNGIPQLVVGTGGAALDAAFRRRTNSAFLDNDVYGVLVLALYADAYQWAFIGIDGRVRDRSADPVSCR